MAAKKKVVSKKKATAVAKKKTVAKKAVAKKTVTKKTVAKKATSVSKKAATSKKPVVKKAAATNKTNTIAKAKETAQKAAPSAATAKSAPVRKPSKASAPVTTSTTTSTGFMGIAPYQEKEGEEYMSEGQVAHFRLILNTWKKELMEEVDRTVHHMQDEAANFPDPNDRATQESDFTMELRARDRERKLIKKIEESIVKLNNDDYGYCDQCGIEIGIRRLEARPTATLCIDCKTLDEIKERHVGG